MSSKTFAGEWFFYHWYPSVDDAKEEYDEYRMHAQQIGHELVLESEPQKNGSYMLVRLTIDGRLANGTWYENAALNGPFDGMTYSGAGQMIVSKDEQRLVGKWAGVGIDRKAKDLDVYIGKWELRRKPLEGKDLV